MIDVEAAMEEAKRVAQEKTIESMAEAMRQGFDWKLRERCAELAIEEFEEHIAPLIRQKLAENRDEIAAIVVAGAIKGVEELAQAMVDKMSENVTTKYGAVDKCLKTLAGDRY